MTLPTHALPAPPATTRWAEVGLTDLVCYAFPFTPFTLPQHIRYRIVHLPAIACH